MRLAALALVLVTLGGCVQSQARTVFKLSGDLDGKPVTLTAEAATTESTGVDVPGAIQGAVAALRGDLRGVLEAVQTAPPPAPVLNAVAEVRKGLESTAAAVQTIRAAQDGARPMTGSGVLDSLLAALAAYTAAKGTVAVHRRMRGQPARPASGG